MPDSTTLQTIAKRLGDELEPASLQAVGGSSLNSTFSITGRNGRYFVKTNTASFFEMMQAEFEGLQELAKAGAVKVPVPLAVGQSDSTSFLAMELLETGPAAPAVHARFGHQLARLHHTTNAFFGWHRDNTIGLTAQVNTRSTDWAVFFRDQRLGVQLDFLQKRSGTARIIAAGRKLQGRLSDYFAGQMITAALLHGDLWGGNWGALNDGTPVMYDPAVYYGDPESDIAMTRLFGGFHENFYAAYREMHPDTDSGPVRRDLYRLYHLLNHCNLFGSGYYSQTTGLLYQLIDVL